MPDESLSTDTGEKKRPRKPKPDMSGAGARLQDPGRSIPCSETAEMGLIGCILIAPGEVLLECIEKVSIDHFHLPRHRTIYEVLLKLWSDSKPIDLVTVTQALTDAAKIEQIGGFSVIQELYRHVPTAANAPFYIEILRQKMLLREVIRTCTEFASRAYEEQDEVSKLVDEFEADAYKINSARLGNMQISLHEHIMRAVEELEKMFTSAGSVSGISTGFRDLDDLTKGLHPAEMFVIAARPSMGKTALAMNIAEHVALRQQLPVAVFSLEMSTQQLIQRLLCSIGRVNLSRIGRGIFAQEDFPNITSAASSLIKAPLFIDDTPSISILELRAKARRLKAAHDIQLIVIDYLQLIVSKTKRAADNRQLEIAEVSAGVKALAKELSVPVIVLAQLNRQPESRGGGEPRLSDLRESGSIEQDADVVGLLVRAEYYSDKDADPAEAAGKAELNIAKQRNGPTGRVPLTFLKEFTRFEDRAKDAPAD